MDGLELYDIYGLWHVPFWQTTTWFVLIGLAIISVVVFFIGMLANYLMQKKTRKELWQQAIDELNQLEKEPCTTPQEAKKIYFSLTALLKKYMVHRYACARMSDTDQEFLEVLKTMPVSAEAQATLNTIFSASSTIKFASMPAMNEQVKRDLEHSIVLIYDTMPVKSK